ncbi:DUF3833 family protein [Pseudoponticoccus marisrubri]|uniref:DUF3833 domain-containing protein n=1 Tax=Pseudoponticoccus marisrubri TaxID=1685382 RepID=A0A0W7WHV8_9RHOB|nr:DUF3833 family protein [Pseudoponticoccus marisrubri]KUF10111.1 hypothetical protein AVJ23_13740 [Pseudoponticoccus marisrubri]
MEAFLYVVLGAALMLGLAWLRSRKLGFLAQRSPDYSDAGGPRFDLRHHLNGDIVCEGVIYGPTGRVASRFVGNFRGEWQGNSGRLAEHFTYDSGAEQTREWQLSLGNDGRIRALAADVEGEGNGDQSGPTVCLRYKLRLPEDAGGHVLDTTDWMYLAPNGTIVNRSQFRKFGFKVAELVAVMRRKEIV